MKKYLYKFAIVLQLFLILSSLANLLYCAIEHREVMFFGTIYLFFVPYFRFLASGNIYEGIVLFLFVIFTIFLFIFAAKDFLDSENRKSWALPSNLVWILYSIAPCLIYTDLHTLERIGEMDNFMPSIFFSFIVILFLFIITLMKFCDQCKNIRNKPDPAKEEFLPEKFEWHCISYKQIRRTSLGSPVIVCVCFILSLTLKYLNGPVVDLVINVLYGFCLFFLIVIFFGTIYEYYNYGKRTGEKPPTKNFLKKLNIIQIVSFIFLALSFLVFTFVL